MARIHGRILCCFYLAAYTICVVAGGCQAFHHGHDGFAVNRLPVVYDDMPREQSKVVLPAYVIEPPDILLIEGIHIVPKPPYTVKTLDVLSIQVPGALPEAPISGLYPVEPGGTLNLGPPYGSVPVAGLSVPEAEQAITQHLRSYLQAPDVSLTLAQMAASQQIIGQFLVGPDGTVTLGNYGSVPVVGKTIAQAKQDIEAHLGQFLDDPVISLNVFGYNSKVYYIILQGAGLGDAVYRFPITGNETVLDALAQINGTEEVSSRKIWVARPTCDPGNVQVLPVDWCAITEEGVTCTNYQILPGDRVFIAEDHLVAFDTYLAKFLSPFERIFGFSILGADTVSRFSGKVLQGGGLRLRNQAILVQ